MRSRGFRHIIINNRRIVVLFQIINQNNRRTLCAFRTNNNLIHIRYYSSTISLTTFGISIWWDTACTERPLCVRAKIIATRGTLQIIGATFRSIASISSGYPNYPIQILSKIFNNPSYNSDLCRTILNQSLYSMVNLLFVHNRIASFEIFLLPHPYFITHLALTIILNKTSIAIIVNCCRIA